MKCLFALIAFVSLQASAQEKTAPAAAPAPAVTPAPTATPTPTPTPEATSAPAAVEAAPAVATVATTAPAADKKDYPKFNFKSYGYFTFSQVQSFRGPNDLRRTTRRKMDLAEIAFEGNYELTPTSKFEFEVEIEHGGVGTAMEFDPFEEFGEFEKELEKGGEVALPEFVYKKTFTKTDTVLKVGRFPLFMSLGTVLEKPGKYAAVNVSDVESSMIPYHWNELGTQVEQKVWNFTGRLGLVNGLNSEFFRSYNWVGGGYQTQFEGVNADDLATVASIEYGSVSKGTGMALAYYNGNTLNNRYKPDKLTEDAYVTIWSFMLNYKLGRFGITGEAIQGTLQNSDLVTKANSSLTGVTSPKSYAPLGHKAVLQSIQLSYDLSDDLIVYVRQEHVDTFAEVEGNITKNPRYDRTRKSGGFMWSWEPGAFMKAQYAQDSVELTGLPNTDWFGLAIGFDIAKFN